MLKDTVLVRFKRLISQSTVIKIISLSLAPKTYFAFDNTTGEVKRSSKGVQKRWELSYKDYKDVLYDNRVVTAENISIRMWRGQMSTIAMKKAGLQNKLIKAYVHVDKVSVSPFEKFQ